MGVGNALILFYFIGGGWGGVGDRISLTLGGGRGGGREPARLPGKKTFHGMKNGFASSLEIGAHRPRLGFSTCHIMVRIFILGWGWIRYETNKWALGWWCWWSLLRIGFSNHLYQTGVLV